MYTSVSVLALTGFLFIPTPQEPQRWHHDYHQAKAVGKQQQKPLAVIIGTGEQGYEKLTGNGKLSPQVQKLLEDRYVCVYVDTTSPKGKQLADALEINRGSGIVLSDRTGDLQAFHHNGTISDAVLAPYLQRFSGSNVQVRDTATVNTQRTSYYPQTNGGTHHRQQPTYTQPRTPYYQPTTPYYPGSYGGYGGFGGYGGGGFGGGGFGGGGGC